MAAANNTGKGAGLELLQHLTQVIIQQKTRVGANTYTVKTVDGAVLFTMKEDNGVMAFLASGKSRGFHIDAVDSLGRSAFSLRRPTVFASDKVEVSIGGRVVSVVRKEQTFMKPLFNINDGNDTPQLRVKGEFTDYEFELQTRDKLAIGSISKRFAGVLKEMFTDTDNYLITFPADLSIPYKAATIATCILIDYRYHEH